MKYAEIKELSLEALEEKLQSEQELLRKLKFSHAISPIENPMRIRHARKLVARLATQKKEREIQNKSR